MYCSNPGGSTKYLLIVKEHSHNANHYDHKVFRTSHGTCLYNIGGLEEKGYYKDQFN